MPDDLLWWMVPAIVLIVGVYWRLFPPRRRNRWYGYRTRRSMAGDGAWRYANRFGANLMLGLVPVEAAISLAGYLWLPQRRHEVILFQAIVILLSILLVEAGLRRKFDLQGEPLDGTPGRAFP